MLSQHVGKQLYPVKLRHIPEERIPQPRHYENQCSVS